MGWRMQGNLEVTCLRIVEMSHSENTEGGHLALKEGQRSSLEVALKRSGSRVDTGSEGEKII